MTNNEGLHSEEGKRAAEAFESVSDSQESREKKQTRFLELKQRYEELYDWAKDQEFTVVYRAEGHKNLELENSQGHGRSRSAEMVGSWYSTNYYLTSTEHKLAAEDYTNGEASVYALIVPQSLLDVRNDMAKGKQEVNVMSEDLREGKIEINDEAQSPEPNLENYLNQFSFVKEYRQLAKELEDN